MLQCVVAKIRALDVSDICPEVPILQNLKEGWQSFRHPDSSKLGRGGIEPISLTIQVRFQRNSLPMTPPALRRARMDTRSWE